MFFLIFIAYLFIICLIVSVFKNLHVFCQEPSKEAPGAPFTLAPKDQTSPATPDVSEFTTTPPFGLSAFCLGRAIRARKLTSSVNIV